MEPVNHTSRPQLACLVLAPVVLVVARLLMTPIDGLPIAYLAAVRKNADNTELGAALAAVAALLLLPALLHLASLARISSPRLAAVGASLGVAGVGGLLMLAAIQGLGARLSVQHVPVATLAALWKELYNSGAVPAVAQVSILAGIAGSVCLAIGLFRSLLVPRAAAVLAGLGSVLIFATAPGPARSLVVGGAVIGLLGLGWVALSTLGSTQVGSAPAPAPLTV
jgi:hypothetical protein